ncbi:UDP-glycosyltransferase 83A1-like [Euphorbia lathyris]|uniref:UDP-glycosyltransferase 83A1-like n=1 Tax=Euphorbia lathyris TaxID=212925 RepID=UPI00331344D0
MERRPHIVAMPYPAQGHVLPMMELSLCLVKHGFRITFVNTDYAHQKVLNALLEKDFIGDHINLVSIPDGMEPWEDRNDFTKLSESLSRVAPGKLQELLHRINASEDDKVTCIIADTLLGWVFEVAEKMKIRKAVFSPASAALLTQLLSVNKLIDDGIIDNQGNPLKIEKIQLAPDMPFMSTTNFVWLGFEDEIMRRKIFENVNKHNKTLKLADRIICNTAYDLEAGAFTLFPKILPIGPLLASSRNGNSAGCFWQEDTNCLKWLDQQPLKSVIYVAFGSITTFDKTQFQELALGLELTGKRFLLVVRPGITKETNVYPQGFEERVGNRGKIVEWASQQKVLSHPSVGCFLSHCGWNSTMEGVANGVPFLCWPYFGDQPINESYICDVWKVGLNFNGDEFGVIKREEIKNKVEQVLGDERIKARAKEVKELVLKSVGECGYSAKIFSNFVEWLNEDSRLSSPGMHGSGIA